MEFLLLFYEYFKIGLFTLGGGYAMLPLVQQAIEKHGWLTKAELVNFIGISESTPGPFSINLATFVGLNVGNATSLSVFGGFLGAAVATLGVVTPSFVIIIFVTRLFVKFRQNRIVQGVFNGVRPAVVGLVLAAVFTIGATVFLPSLDFSNLAAADVHDVHYVSLLLFVVLLAASKIKIRGKKIHPIALIFASAGLGVLLFGVLKLPL